MKYSALPYAVSFSKLKFALTHRIAPFAVFVALCGLSLSASAAPLDAAATKKINESINVHYLATKFTKAEAVLLGTIKACSSRCSKSVIARAYMYVGIVRGAGNGDIKGAKKAFEEAVTLDAFVKLDQDLATEELRQAFEDAGGDPSAVAEPTAPAPKAATKAARPKAAAIAGPPGGIAAPPGGSPAVAANAPMYCIPVVTEVQTRRSIPVSCRSGKPVKKLVLYYREFGNPSWSQVNMAQSGSDWLGQVPCSATMIQGNLTWYVVGMGDESKPIDSFASEQAPTNVAIVPETDAAAPAFGGQPPPQRCSDASDCPPDMIGTPACPGTGGSEGGSSGGDLGWGAACEEHLQCEEGLFCLNGSCDMAPSCDTDADCEAGTCDGSVCEIDREDSFGEASSGDSGSFFTLSVGADLALLSGEGICNPHPDHSTDYQCYLGDEPYETPARDPLGVSADPSYSGNFPSSFVPGTIRAMLGYEYVIGDVIGIEAQVGLAVNKAPSASTAELFHASIRGKYWFNGTGEGIKPFVSLGVGLGEVNARKTVSTLEWWEDETSNVGVPRVRGAIESEVREAVEANDMIPADQKEIATEQITDERYAEEIRRTGQFEGRGQGFEWVCGGQERVDCLVNPVNAWVRLGSSFVAGSVGAMLNLGFVGITAEIQAKYMLPRTALVAQPTLGAAFGF